jgi:hypothetical protein
MYGLKQSAPKSRRYRLSLPAQNKSVFTSNDQIKFEIPTGRKGTYLDQTQSYLKFGVQAASTAVGNQGGSDVYLDRIQLIHSFKDKIFITLLLYLRHKMKFLNLLSF